MPSGKNGEDQGVLSSPGWGRGAEAPPEKRYVPLCFLTFCYQEVMVLSIVKS